MRHASSVLNFIPNDGYTEHGFIKAIPGIHGDVRFEFRPMPIDVRTAMFAAIDKLPADAQDHKTALEVASRIVSWDLVDEKGTPLKSEARNVIRLKPALFNRLFAIVSGTGATDIDPNLDQSDRVDEAEIKRLAAECGRNPGDVRAESNEGN